MDAVRGLTDREAEAQRKKFGSNVLEKEKRSPAIAVFLNQFKNYMVYVLLAAAVLSLAVGEDLNAQVIGCILVIVLFLGFVQEYKATKAMESLKAMLSMFTRVIRNGKEMEIYSSDIVPEDTILLKAGDRVPADAAIIESKDLFVDESTLTGESMACAKKAVLASKMHSSGDDSRLFMGTYILSGKAKAIVTHTGMNTRFGKIAKLVETEYEEIPLEKDIKRLSRSLAAIVFGVAIVLFTIMWYRTGFASDHTIVDAAVIVISVAVAGIPEGMPVVVTVMLALGMKNMASKNAIVRKMNAVESLGTVTVICTDKTGTLTKNEMTVKKLFFGKKMHVLSDDYGGDDARRKKAKPIMPVLSAMALCNDAVLEEGGDKPRVSGMPTEAALMLAAAKLGVYEWGLETKFPRIDEAPFNSERKIMSTLHRKGTDFLLLSKGSFEAVIKRCSKIAHEDGTISPLGQRDIKRLDSVNASLCKDAMRVIAFASRRLNGKSAPSDIPAAEKDMVFLGLAAIEDPLRPEAKTSVRKCMDAGIKVVMITGDHPETAAAIGRKLGIISRNSGVITGNMIDEMTDEEFKKRVKDIRICARARPEHKLRIVSALESEGEIVAMTGDGVNDAPALKKADVGVAMGISGTDVSRQASDIVLKDDRFSTIVDAVEEGRHIFGNIRKFVTYQLACNFAEVSVTAASVVMGMSLPLIALQILFINLVTDDLPSIALSQNPRSPSLMSIPPRKPKENLVNRKLLAMILVVGTSLAVGAIVLFNISFWKGVDIARTMAMLSIILAELVIIFSFRSLKKPLSRTKIFANMWLVWAVAVSFAATLAIIYVPQLSAIFGTHPLTVSDWIVSAIPAAITLAVTEIYKKYGLSYTY